jgi:hypothetical protein
MRFMLVTLVVALGLFAAGCAGPNPYEIPPRPESVPPGAPPEIPTEPGEPTEVPQEPEPPPSAPRTREYQLGTASRSLVTQAQTQAANGNYGGAAASLERALRIEPSNPLLWIELGKIRQAEGNHAQAESMGRKAVSLATGDPRAQASAWRLVADSLRARGRVQQAQEAEATAAALVTR